jgi:membrane-associated protease RseP (regulator of RpoE activity)
MSKKNKTKFIQIGLFVATLLTTTISGAEWIFGRSLLFEFDKFSLADLLQGLKYSIPFLGFLTVHEFGHYFMAKSKKIKVSLPFYFPIWLGVVTSFGTLGAFIRIKQTIKTKKDYFDIGIAGPLAGFVIALAILIYGFVNLEGLEYILKIHPEYTSLGANYKEYLSNNYPSDQASKIGGSLLYDFLESSLANPANIPHPYEEIHYPFLLAGFLGLFFTALNLIPIGQLDGGHILYALIGDKYFNIVSPVLFVLFVFFSGLGLFSVEEFKNIESQDFNLHLGKFVFFVYFNYLCFSKIFNSKINNLILALSIVLAQFLFNLLMPQVEGYSGFLAFCFLLGRVLGVYHPVVSDEQGLDFKRKILGWCALLIFVLSFSLYPFS